MKKSTSNSGKAIAVILILMFFGINFYKSQTEGGPQEERFAKAREIKAQNQKFENNLAKHHDIQKLKFAYTGNWEPNAYQGHNLDGDFAFKTPENTRGQIQATAAKKAADAKKKSKLAKKTKQTPKLARKYGRSRFDMDDGGIEDSAPYSRTSYYTKPMQQERTPSDEEKEKKLTAKEWMDKIIASNSVNELVSKYLSKEVEPGLFYSIIESLLSSDQDGSKKLGYTALASTPSVASLTKYVNHMEDEMSADVKLFAQNSLSAYNQPNHLKVLNSALNSSDNKVKILAATIIKNIANSVLISENAGENAVYTEAQILLFKTMLGQSLTVITNAIKTGLEGEVLASFSSTQSVLIEIIG